MAKTKVKAIVPKELVKRKPEEWKHWASKFHSALLLVQSAKDDGYDILEVFTVNDHLYLQNEDPIKLEWYAPNPDVWRWFAILTYYPKRKLKGS